ncbi:uncharacterized protein LOC135357517 [Latimeria chalumnae]|uniref:uncharacterized protein LOC135357517 n=1 Tax=Latimeria chalumnae TaxID=7897 RepID=UPI00313DCC37
MLGALNPIYNDNGFWNGGYKVKVQLKTSDTGLLHLPNFIFIGQDRGNLFYPGQPKVCSKCGSSRHFRADCAKQYCTRCSKAGHVSSNCTNSIVCNLCNREGHLYINCPRSINNCYTSEFIFNKTVEETMDEEADVFVNKPEEKEEEKQKETTYLGKNLTSDSAISGASRKQNETLLAKNTEESISPPKSNAGLLGNDSEEREATNDSELIEEHLPVDGAPCPEPEDTPFPLGDASDPVISTKLSAETESVFPKSGDLWIDVDGSAENSTSSCKAGEDKGICQAEEKVSKKKKGKVQTASSRTLRPRKSVSDLLVSNLVCVKKKKKEKIAKEGGRTKLSLAVEECNRRQPVVALENRFEPLATGAETMEVPETLRSSQGILSEEEQKDNKEIAEMEILNSSQGEGIQVKRSFSDSGLSEEDLKSEKSGISPECIM